MAPNDKVLPVERRGGRLVSLGEESTLNNTIESSYQAIHLLGYGFNIMRGEVAAHALAPFSTSTNETRDEYIYVRSITNQSEMRQELDFSVKGDYTLDGIDIGVSAGFINEVEASAMSMSLVAEYSSTNTGYSLAEPGAYALTSEAAALFEKSGQAAFQEKYGHYFIAGHRYGAKFFAVYRCTSHESKSFQEFKSELSVSAPELFEADAALRFSNLAKSKNVTVDIQIVMVGVPNNVTPPPLDGLTPEQILPVLNWFRGVQKGQPVETLFMSYSNLLAAYSNKINVRPDLMSWLRLLYGNYWLLQFLFRSLPPFYEQQQRSVYLRLTTEIEVKHSEFMSDGELLDRYFGQTENLLYTFQEILGRQALYFRIQRELLERPEPETGARNHEGGIALRSYGITILDMELNSYVTTEQVTLAFGDIPFEWIEKRYPWENGNRTIIGWRIESMRDNNGYWVKESTTQGCLGHELRLYFCSGWWQGMHYRVSVFSIENDLFRFGPMALKSEAGQS